MPFPISSLSANLLEPHVMEPQWKNEPSLSTANQWWEKVLHEITPLILGTVGEGAKSNPQCWWSSCRWKLHNVWTILPCKFLGWVYKIFDEKHFLKLSLSQISTWCGPVLLSQSLTHQQYQQKRWSFCEKKCLFFYWMPDFFSWKPKSLESLWVPSPSLQTLPPGQLQEPFVMLWLSQEEPER